MNTRVGSGLKEIQKPSSHCVNRRVLIEPVFQRERPLMKEQGKSVGDSGSLTFGVAKEVGSRRVVDGVVDQMMRFHPVWRERGGIA